MNNDGWGNTGAPTGWGNTPAAPVITEPSLITPDVEELLKEYKLPIDKEGVLALHEKLKSALTSLKAVEMHIRQVAFKLYVPKANEGTNTVELENGYELKGVVKFNYKLADNDTVEKGLDEISKVGNQGAFIADRLVSWTPNFLITEYRMLQEEKAKGSIDAEKMLKIIDTFLTITEGAPTLEIKPPKVKKK